MKTVFYILLLMSVFSSYRVKQSVKDNVYLNRAEDLFQTVWFKYRLPQHRLFAEYYPNSYQPDLTYFQDSTYKAQETSFLWPMSGVFSAVNILVEHDSEKYSAYQDSMVMAVENYYDCKRVPAGYQAYPVKFKKVDRYYDDNGLVGIDYVDAYKISGNPAYLDKAEVAMEFIMSGWGDDWGGAVSWLEGYKDQKPACSNGKAAVLSLKLYEATGDTAYLERGKQFYNWMMNHLEDDSLHIIWNSWLTGKGEVQKQAYTYNTGTMIQSAVRLYKATKNENYLADARRLAKGSYDFYVKYMDNGIPYITDLPWFIVVLFRGYHELYEIDGNSKYVDTIIASADWAWTHARDKSGLIYVDWTGRAQEYDKPKWLLNEACMVELYARIALIKDVNKKIENYE